VVNGIRMEQWQYEVTGVGRLWYGIEDDRRTVCLADAAVGHPKATEWSAVVCGNGVQPPSARDAGGGASRTHAVGALPVQVLDPGLQSAS